MQNQVSTEANESAHMRACLRARVRASMWPYLCTQLQLQMGMFKLNINYCVIPSRAAVFQTNKLKLKPDTVEYT